MVIHGMGFMIAKCWEATEDAEYVLCETHNLNVQVTACQWGEMSKLRHKAIIQTPTGYDSCT